MNQEISAYNKSFKHLKEQGIISSDIKLLHLKNPVAVVNNKTYSMKGYNKDE